MDVVWAAISRVASAAWDGLKSAITGAISGIVGWVKGNWPIIATLISGPFAPLVALATNAFGIRSALVGAFNGIKSAITGIVTGVAGWIGNEAATIGKNLVSGIIDGLGGLYDALKNKLEGTIHSVVTGLSPFSTVRQGGAEHIGAPLAQGVIDGWLLGVAQLPSKISQSLQNAVQAGQRVIQSAQSSFQTAWQQLASDADTAFRGITSAIQTPAEKTLAALQSEHDQAQRSKALTDAQAQLADAQAGGDPAAIASAQQAVADAQYAIQVAALEKQAALQRTQLDARHALQQRHFDAALAQLETHLAKAHSSYAAAHTAILKLFKSFGINYQSAGGDLGSAFITGLKESIQKAAKGAGSLTGALTDVAAGIHVPHAATGGVVSQTGLAVIHAGETIIPAGSGATVNITVNGWVGSDQAIAEKLRNELIRLGRNTTGGALGGFA
jgi:phage-related protein